MFTREQLLRLLIALGVAYLRNAAINFTPYVADAGAALRTRINALPQSYAWLVFTVMQALAALFLAALEPAHQ